MWPKLEYDEWKDTLDTLHMWMQIVGKVKLKLAPFVNQWWEVAMYVTANGITTGLIPSNTEIFQIDFNFLDHRLTIYTISGKTKIIALKPQTVADFYTEFMDALKQLGIDVKIWPVPVEVADTTPFDQDTKHASYDKEYVEKWWHTLVKVHIVFEQFRTSFCGKSSPIHFFWGSFDLNGARFSGKPVEPPKMKGTMGKIMKFAENEENFAFGFWPGDQRFPHPAFFSYIYPAPKGYASIKLDNNASFNEQLSECVLLYEDVRKAKNPGKEILHFLETSYNESATLAGWDIPALQSQVPQI